MLNKDNIDQLLLKHLLQENAVEEEQLLKEWLGHDPEHQRYFERFRRHHIHLQAAIQSGRIQGQYIEFASRLKRRHIRRLFIRVAAIALILLGGGLSFYLIHTPSDSDFSRSSDSSGFVKGDSASFFRNCDSRKHHFAGVKGKRWNTNPYFQ